MRKLEKKLIWLSFDLSIRGNYESVFQWLDSHEAKECGNYTAVMAYPYTNDLKEELLTDLHAHIEFKKHDRVYLVCKSEEGKSRGTFIVGGRKAAPWAGYAISEEEDDELEIED